MFVIEKKGKNFSVCTLLVASIDEILFSISLIFFFAYSLASGKYEMSKPKRENINQKQIAFLEQQE